MTWWKIDSDLHVEAACKDPDLRTFAVACHRVLAETGASDPVVSGDPAKGTVHATFLVNTVDKREHANTRAMKILASLAEALDEDDWKIYSSSTSAELADQPALVHG